MMSNDIHQQKSSFRLLRVISIDSYSLGGEVILKVDGGAILTGENGAGKTSLIRLIPVFFGELPRRISVGTQSFADFYLARTTSYIIFEYERRGVVCQAVVYAGHGDEAYVYRFIRAPYRLELFTEADGKAIITGDSLPTHLKKLGVDCSRALAHDSYRAIIQGRSHSGREAAIYREYVADYAFTVPGSRLDHIDRIVSGMFRRQAEFKDFLRMVVSYISDKEDPIAVSGDRNKIAVWPKQYAAYQAVMRLAPRMDEVNQRDAEILACDGQLSVLHAKLLSLITYAHKQAEQSWRLHDESQKALEVQSNKHAAESEALSREEVAARIEASQYEERVATLDGRQAEYEKDELEHKAHLVGELPMMQEKHQAARERREILVGDQARIDQEYSALKLTETSALNDRTVAALQDKEVVQKKFDVQIAELSASHEARKESLHLEHQGFIDSAQEIADKLRDEAVRLEQAARNPTADPLLMEAWQRKQEAVDNKRRAGDAPKKRLERAVDAQKIARAAYERQDAVVRELVQQVDKLGGQIERLNAQANPPPGSLLSFLRAERPDWPLDIARVINEDLLSRTDLAPEAVENGVSALYGVSIDLSRIDGPLFSDELRLRDEIRAIEALQGRVRDESKIQEGALKKAHDILKDTEREVLDAQAAVTAAEAELQTAVAEERASRGQMQQSTRDNQKKSQEAAALARGRERDALRKRDDAREARSAAEKRLSELFASERQKIDHERTKELQSITARITADRQKVDEHLRRLDNERNQALSQQGIDVDTLKKIDDEIETLARNIGNAKAWRVRVDEWKAWLSGEWSSRSKLTRQAQEYRDKESKAKERLKAKTESWIKHSNAEGKRIAELERAAKAATETAETCTRRIEQYDLANYPPDQVIQSQPYDLSWSQDSLLMQVTKSVNDKRLATSRLKVRVDEIKNAFRAGAGTPTEDFFQSTAEAVDPNNDNPAGWIAPLRDWYGHRHEEYLRPLLVEARKFGEMIIGFQRDVERFSQRIRTFNAAMQKALDETIVFARISQVSIHFASTIAEKKYWQPINAFIANHESWIRGISHDLPPASFANDLDQLLEHWDIREGIRAERLSLIDASGSVVENGVEKKFRDSSTLGDLSSNGLSYLILIVIFVAFLRMIRGDANVRVTYAVDELGDLDRKNIGILVDMLRRNGIDLVSACPDTDLVVLQQFPNRYRVTRDSSGPYLVEMDLDDIWEASNV